MTVREKDVEAAAAGTGIRVKSILRSWHFWIVLALAAACVFRFWQLDTLPTGYNNDEMGTAYDAWSLLNYGVDRYRTSWPVYLKNYGDGQSVLYCYMMVACFAVFGYGKLAIRLPAAINSMLLGLSGVGIIGLAWKDGWKVRKEVPQLLFAVIYAVSPYVQMSARIGLDCNAMLGWSTFFLYTFLLAIRRSEQSSGFRALYYVLSGVVGGITLYSYAITYLVLPLFLILSLLYVLLCRKIRVRKQENGACVSAADILAFAIPLVLLAIPLLLVQYVNITGSESFKLFGVFTITKLSTYRSGEFTFSNMWNNFILTIKASVFHDGLDYNTSSKYWTFYPMSVPFFFIGWAASFLRAGRSLKRKEFDPYVLPVLWFCAQLFVCCLLGEEGSSANPNANKVNGIFFTVMLFIVTGYVVFFRNLTRARWKKVLAGILAAAYLVMSSQFLYYFFTEYRPTRYWRDTFSEVIEFIEEDPILSQKDTLIQTNWMDTNYIYYLNSALPSPYEVDITTRDFGNYYTDIWDFEEYVEVIYGYGANYLVYQCDEDLAEYFADKGFEVIVFGSYTLFCYR